ncbi:hypothetical protein [Mycobacterium sp. 29Ha]|uniref:hypothetical protein n=1 Tax=Mycobacterium sp. 29Ha TaxID=2939268 RepID=UPI002938F026|nr:hypothetical protein [Mycobacterium sp. 29Ha]MDV3131348.1 hypothetical protein [Mycobacterium sp. 29Ha]
MRGDFELAEVMWESADPCLSEAERQAVLTALHAGEPYTAMLVLATALSRSGYPVPSDVHIEFCEWLRQLPEWDTHNGGAAVQLELHVMAADIQVSTVPGADDGPFGDATLCYFVLDDAGVADASRDRQADALRKWLQVNKPSPSLRADMQANGFGYLLPTPEPPPAGGHRTGGSDR